MTEAKTGGDAEALASKAAKDEFDRIEGLFDAAAATAKGLGVAAVGKDAAELEAKKLADQLAKAEAE